MTMTRWTGRGWVALACLWAAAVIAAAPAASADDGHAYNGAPTVQSGGPVPTLNGVPCVGGHLGTCTGFAQNSPKRQVPQSTVGGSPTINR